MLNIRIAALSADEEWVLCSPHRAERSLAGTDRDSGSHELPSYDPNCYLCPGNERAGHVTNPDYRATFVFDNDYAALLPLAGIAGHEEDFHCTTRSRASAVLSASHRAMI